MTAIDGCAVFRVCDLRTGSHIGWCGVNLRDVSEGAGQTGAVFATEISGVVVETPDGKPFFVLTTGAGRAVWVED